MNPRIMMLCSLVMIACILSIYLANVQKKEHFECPAGYYGDNKSTCTKCPVGYTSYNGKCLQSLNCNFISYRLEGNPKNPKYTCVEQKENGKRIDVLSTKQLDKCSCPEGYSSDYATEQKKCGACPANYGYLENNECGFKANLNKSGGCSKGYIQKGDEQGTYCISTKFKKPIDAKNMTCTNSK